MTKTKNKYIKKSKHNFLNMTLNIIFNPDGFSN